MLVGKDRPVHARAHVVDGVVAIVAREEVQDRACEVARGVVLVLLGAGAAIVLRKVDGDDPHLREELGRQDDLEVRQRVPGEEGEIHGREGDDLAAGLLVDRPALLALLVHVGDVLHLDRRDHRWNEEEQVQQVVAPAHLRGADDILWPLRVLVVREVVAGDQRGDGETVGERQHNLPGVVLPLLLELRHMYAVVHDRCAEP
mmetsp:Transcript_56329/g.126966  ORF Transcript_56329/g.126966 Transcript_56329/m.126966 type:complete len:202 (-) Transcript_56329:135-740(-)